MFTQTGCILNLHKIQQVQKKLDSVFVGPLLITVGEGRVVDVVYLDFREVFDGVFHTILIDKLKKY